MNLREWQSNLLESLQVANGFESACDKASADRLWIYHNNYYLACENKLLNLYPTLERGLGKETRQVLLAQFLQHSFQNYQSLAKDFLSFLQDFKEHRECFEQCELQYKKNLVLASKPRQIWPAKEFKQLSPSQLQKLVLGLSPDIQLISKSESLLNQHTKQSNQLLFLDNFEVGLEPVSEQQYAILVMVQNRVSFQQICQQDQQAYKQLVIFIQKGWIDHFWVETALE